VLLLASGWVPASAVVGLMASIGFLTGLAGPSRICWCAVLQLPVLVRGPSDGYTALSSPAWTPAWPWHLLVFGADGRGRFTTVLVGIALLQVVAIGTAMRVVRT
jgi:hypothetical protein